MSEAYVIAINRLITKKIILYDKVYEQGSNSKERKKNMTYVIFGETRMVTPRIGGVADSNERWIKIFCSLT